MTNPPPPDDNIELIKELDGNNYKAHLQITSKINELVRSANKHHGPAYTVINAKADLFMNNKTDDHESAVLRWGFNPAIPITRPVGVFIALFTSNPGETGVVSSEISGTSTGYSRISCLFDDPANGFTLNITAVQFPTSLASWGIVTYVGVCRGATRGVQDLMYYGPLTTPINVNAANFSPQFAPGTLTISEKPIVAGLSGIFQGNATFTGTLSGIVASSDLNVTTEEDYFPRPSKVTLPQIIIDVKDSYPGSVNVDLTDTGNTTTNATNLRNALNTSLTSLTSTRIRLPNNFTAVFSTPLEPSGPHANPGVWTTIEWINKPTAGVRVSPSVMANSPKLISSAVSPVFLMKNGEDRVRLIGLTIYTTTTNNFGLVVQGSGETTLGAMPSDMIVDRCYIHANGLQVQHGVTLNGKYGSVINCYIYGLKWSGVESQAVNGYSGPGPFRIDNNFLYADSISVLFGGAEPNIIGVHPSDVLVRRNHGFRPISDKLLKASLVTKNCFEIKHGQRFLFEGNVAQNSWEDAQAGMLFNFQTLGASWNESKDITMRYNKGINGCELVVCSARGFDNIAMKMNRVDINNNIGLDIGYDGTSRGFLLTADLDTVYIEHNTITRNASPSGACYLFDRGSGAQASNIKIRNNIGGRGIPFSTVFQSGGKSGNDAINDYGGPTSEFLGNITWQESLTAKYTVPSNKLAAKLGDLHLTPDHKLPSDSPYKNSGTDGIDPGANIDDVNIATNGVQVCDIITTNGAVANSVFARPVYINATIEPDFKSKFRRICGDPGTPIPFVTPALTWPSFIRHHYSKDQPWDASQRYYALTNTDGSIGAGAILILDGYGFDPLFKRAGIPGGGEWRWHPTLPGIGICLSNTGVVRHWDVLADTNVVKYTLPAGYSNIEFGPYEGNPSYNGQFIACKAVRNSDSHLVGFALDINTGFKYPDIDLTAVGFGSLDWVSISAGGAYVVAFSDAQDTMVWNAITGAVVQSWLSTNRFGHFDLGIDVNGNEIAFGGTNGGTHAHMYVMRDLQTGVITDLTPPNSISFNFHSSCRAFNRPGWAFGSINDSLGFTYDSEIVAVKLTTGAQQVERWGRHRDLTSSGKEALACPSPDGKRVAFTSNWGDVSTLPIQDFIIDTRDICP